MDNLFFFFFAESFRILSLSLYLDCSCFENYYAGSLLCSFDLKTHTPHFRDIFSYFSLLISFCPFSVFCLWNSHYLDVGHPGSSL